MKPGGYSDSGSDIAFVLQTHGVDVITPTARPSERCDLDWVFPDTADGIQHAIDAGARVLWANTVLFADHPLKTELEKSDVRIVGQHPEVVEKFDDKWVANSLLRAKGLSVPHSMLVALAESNEGAVLLGDLTEALMHEAAIGLPCVVKPIRGRGSQGVRKVDSFEELKRVVRAFLMDVYELDGVTYSTYGNRYIVEEYLSNEEITVTVMPPGIYQMGETIVEKDTHWCLPIVGRYNHQHGIAPYSGVKAVVTNSSVFTSSRMEQKESLEIMEQCARTASIIGAKAPIRCDCRSGQASDGFAIFDVNMKPNMTGSGRPGREDQDSLTVMAAKAVGWSYFDFLLNMLAQAWTTQRIGQELYR
ncbi:D-alanine--D-alanine ligase [Gracilaria domingensis]|nr:D-alanine--D-alanine ligase [Gracilaria domingensis]